MQQTKLGIVAARLISPTYFNATKKINIIEVEAC